GPKVGSDKELLEMVEGAMQAGARGVAIGRNVFQHDNPTAFTRLISLVVHEGISTKEAIEIKDDIAEDV
ncbi:MAG: fructose-bisphosphate aldolase, partial [Methermicoccaceae archaeon]